MRVFYSWQSDRQQNRRLIKEAAEAAAVAFASSAEFDDAPRPDIVIDQDTSGVPGSPPIAETILAKITSADAFLADLTFIDDGASRRTPNPNVLVELGYALARPGGESVVCVMNTAYGEPSELPFDLAHRRWPLRFHLPDGAAKDLRQRALKDLTEGLSLAFGAIHRGRRVSPVEAGPAFEAATPADGVGALGNFNLPICFHGSKAQPVFMRPGPYAFLRVIPTEIKPLLTNVEAEAVVRDRLFTMDVMRGGGGWQGRHATGAVNYWVAPDDPQQAWAASQVFRTRELWGVNAHILANSAHKEPDIRYVPTGALESDFADALINFVDVATLDLGLACPLRIIAGLAGVEGMHLAVGRDQYGADFIGPILQPSVIFEKQLTTRDFDPVEFLMPLFEAIYDAAVYVRPALKPTVRRQPRSK